MIEDRYQIAAPAISNFFRDKFIACESATSGRYGWPHERECAATMNQYISKISNGNLEITSLISPSGIGLPDQQTSPESVQMMQMLNALSIVQRGQYLLDMTVAGIQAPPTTSQPRE